MPKTKKFFYQDKSGRGFTANYSAKDVRIAMKGERSDYTGQAASTWAASADVGDEWSNAANKLTRIS